MTASTSNRQRLLMILAGAAVLLMVLDSLVLTPLTKGWQTRRAEIAKLQKNVAEGRRREQGCRSCHGYRHRKIRSATKKDAAPQAVMIRTGIPRSGQPAPSSMIARSALFNAVSGRIWMNGCMTAGKWSDAKNTPDRIHIGTATMFM